MPAPIFDEPTTPSLQRPRLDWRQLRDTLGLVLILVGVIGLVVTAWVWHPLAGSAALFVAIIGLGVFLGLDW